ncbi:unnamed protein product [Clavelina lepadiformis]|uniref:TIR domain-containing protein n=1 Tax=Clavelina lepadiformis TaxID=159417 RepID=A0ABP0FE73_CLALP
MVKPECSLVGALLMKINLWNYSDKCRNLAQACYEHKELVKRCMREFTLPDRDIASLKNNRKRYALKASLGFLMNIVRLYSPNVELIRANDGIQTIFKFYESTYLIIKAKVMMLLSFCINEEENEKIMAGTGVINFIVKLLKNALDSANHIGKTYAFSAAETVMGLDKLAANDNNKKQIVEAGVLPLLVSMLNEKCRAEEHNVATHCIWTLSFHPSNRENIREEPGLLEAVHRILQNKDSEPGTKCSCDGIVFLIEGVEPKLRDAEVEQKHDMHIMISYQWDVQATILQLRDNLRERGYKIWIDVDQVQGSILTEMASAVENAIVVIVAMTENYKNSNPCRTEAEYAYKLSKPIVPLLLQPHYKPDGWLGALLGMQLYVDLSNSEIVEQKFADVDRLIASKTKTQALNQESFVAPISETVVDARPLHALPRQIRANTSTHAVSGICTKWSRDDVLEWGEKNSIVSAVATLCDFDGIGLMQLVQLLKRSPDVYYSALKNDFKMEWLQIFHLTNALEHLP